MTPRAFLLEIGTFDKLKKLEADEGLLFLKLSRLFALHVVLIIIIIIIGTLSADGTNQPP